MVTCKKKWISYNHHGQPAQWLDQEAAPRHFPKPSLHQTKVMVTVWWPATCLIHYSLLNPSKTIMLSKLMRCTENCDAQPALVKRKGPILQDNIRLHVIQPRLQKLKELGYEVLPHPPRSPDLLPTTTSSSISTTFYRECTSTTSRRQKMLSKSLSNLGAQIFMPQE